MQTQRSEFASYWQTDYIHWRLKLGEGGRHTWHYLHSEKECVKWPQTDIDKYWLGLPLNAPTLPHATTPLEAAVNGYTFFKRLQAPDGHFAGEYSGPMFVLPGVVIASYLACNSVNAGAGAWFEEQERREMIKYLLNRAHPEDGGWGLHVEGPSTVLGIALNYCALRLLGVERDHPAIIKARETLHRLGGATAAPSWGKFWLSVLNVYSWDGNNPIPPELWLFPEWLPFHPHKWWVHTRAVYLPMSYLYRVRYQGPETPLVQSLREELYTQPYSTISWTAQRNNISPVDLYTPHSSLLNIFNFILSHTSESYLARHLLRGLRRRSLDRVYELICMEDINTSYQDIAPVSKMMQILCRAHREGADSVAVRKHIETRGDVMWLGPDGLRARGTNGSQLWDTAFTAQALVDSGLAKKPEYQDSVRRILQWLDEAQMTENPIYWHSAYRQATKGAWGFSTKEQGYTLSDCTGEALKAILYLQDGWDEDCSGSKPVSDERIYDSVDLLLSMQNPIDGGFPSYEKVRGPRWLEYINPAEVFGNIMTEFTYPECTTSVITALTIFRKRYPNYRARDIDDVLRGAIRFLHVSQRAEGGWYGSWGICFTYATMFALESLALVGETYATSKTARKACHFLVDRQMEDGGWGESYKSCELEKYVQHEASQVVQTSWAAMALMYAHYPDHEPIKRAVRLVMSRQLPDGSWGQEAIEGVFNKNCTIAYPNFKFTFTIWMLGKAQDYLGPNAPSEFN